MESYIFSRFCLPEKIVIPLLPYEELSIHLIKTPYHESIKMILYGEDSEQEIHKQSYIDMEYLFFQFLVETSELVEIHLILNYDREQEKFTCYL
jgi:hypothetical protein